MNKEGKAALKMKASNRTPGLCWLTNIEVKENKPWDNEKWKAGSMLITHMGVQRDVILIRKLSWIMVIS